MSEPIVMPSFGMYTAEGTLINWLAADGAIVEAGQPVAEIETDKAVNEMVAPAAGRLQHRAAVGALVKEEGVIGYVAPDGEARPGPAPLGQRNGTETVADPFIKASPHARHLARQHDLDLARIKPSGPNGRIVAEDVKAAIALLSPPSGAIPPKRPASEIHRPEGPAPPGAPDLKASTAAPAHAHAKVPVERRPLSSMRRTIGERLAHSQATTVALTLTREVAADMFVKARAGLAEKLGHPVSFDALFVKVFADALREHPDLNAAIEGTDVLRFAEVNIGFAVSTAAGLVVPVVHQAHDKRLRTIVEEMRSLIAKATGDALRGDDTAGGTATISNLGAHGIDAFTPVINPPQASILGIGRIKRRLQVRDDGAFFTGSTCWLSFTFDHRVADGVPAATLLDAVNRRMNDADYLWGL